MKVANRLSSLFFGATIRLLQIFRKRVTIEIALVECRFFGHVALEPEVVALRMRTAVHAKDRLTLHLLSLPLRGPVQTKELVRLRKRQFLWIPTFVTSRLQAAQLRLGVFPIRIESFGYHELNQLAISAPTLHVKECSWIGRNHQDSEELGGGDEIVTLTLREPEIHQLQDRFRDRNFEEFLDAIQGLESLGVKVVKMGRSVTRPGYREEQFKLFYDYASSGKHSLSAEIQYAKNSLFCVSSLTGYDALCLALRRPVFYLDSARLFYLFLGTELAHFNFPTFRDSKSMRQLHLSELLERGWATFKNPMEFDEAKISVQQSDRNLIRDYMSDMVAICRGVRSPTAFHQGLQDRFAEIVLKYDLGAVAARHGEPRARLSLLFLDRFGEAFIK
jgi:putative glycosyltransferase (TIGR04372 family)